MCQSNVLILMMTLVVGGETNEHVSANSPGMTIKKLVDPSQNGRETKNHIREGGGRGMQGIESDYPSYLFHVRRR